ncbi:variable surface protein [Plasmodium gonderi]|uniref:Variable surface protein n=1 Tax=Plasmodium gonderi TaxID=77519 RepID=A0A1Y1JQ34_PLAGO|nr:variable surface protein [Plasmodium gonderi]GAW84591.1 variable surface protein [Plasmodium gonderi]
MLINHFDLSILPSQKLYRNIDKGYSVINDDDFWEEIENKIISHSDVSFSKELISGFTYGVYRINKVEEKDEIWNFLYFWTGEKIWERKYNFRDVMEILNKVIDKFDVQKTFVSDLISITNKDDFSKLKMIFDYIHDYETIKHTIAQSHVECSTQMVELLKNYFMKYAEVKNKCDSVNDTLCQIFKKFMGIKKNNGNLEKLTCRAVRDKEIEVKEDVGIPKIPQKDQTFTHVILLGNTEENSELRSSVEVGYYNELEDPVGPEEPLESEADGFNSTTVSNSANGGLEQGSVLKPDVELKPNGKFEVGDIFEQRDGIESHDDLEISTVTPEVTILQKADEHLESAVTPELTESKVSNGLSESDTLPKIIGLSDTAGLPDTNGMSENTVSHPPNVVSENPVMQVPATLNPVGSLLNPVEHPNGLNNAIKTDDSSTVKSSPEMYSFFSSTYTKAAGVLLFLGILIPMLIVYILSVLFSKVQNRYFRKKKKPYHLYFDKTHVYPFYYDRMSEGKPYYKQNVGYYPLMIE